MELDSSNLTNYADSASLLQHQKKDPIIGWEVVVNMLEQWEVVLMAILGLGRLHPAVYDITNMIGMP